MSSSWEFTQLGVKGTKTLKLQGYNAPFGRPRKDPVLKELIKSRVQTTNYPGRSGRPTRHSFGTNWEAMELKGRWMTKMMTGSDTARSVANDWSEFVADEMQIRMSWGNIVSYIGYIEELELSRESEHHIAWRMKILIDKNDDSPAAKANALQNPPISTMVDGTFVLIEGLEKKLKATTPNLNTDFLDQIDFAVRALNGPSAIINKLAGQISDVEKATFSTLGHFRGAIKGFEIAFVEFRNLIMDTQIDAGNFARSAESDIAWIQFQMDLDLHGNDILALMAAMDRKVELAQRQQFTKVIRARQTPTFILPGDTRETLLFRGESWESLSIRATGTAQNASKIREANGGGGHAIPGEVYLVP